MTDQAPTLETSLAELSKPDWLHAIAQIAEEDGMYQKLGNRHFATFIEAGPTLLVTFETIQGMHALSPLAQPFGWEMLKDHDWSHLCLVSDGDTWFRDDVVYSYVDRLVDDGFFDEFETVIFYGAGPCGYAAGAFSVAAPMARVVLIQPQATIDPRIADWDDRFADMRRIDFANRYGYAPDMLDAAETAFVLYDPLETLDAMHAALFTRPHVTKLRMTHMGGALQTDLMEMERLAPLLLAVEAGTLDSKSFADLYRARRDYRPYLRNLLIRLETYERPLLAAALCRNVANRLPSARGFAKRLKGLEARLAELS